MAPGTSCSYYYYYYYCKACFSLGNVCASVCHTPDLCQNFFTICCRIML